jgi:hypothetical protein
MPSLWHSDTGTAQISLPINQPIIDMNPVSVVRYLLLGLIAPLDLVPLICTHLLLIIHAFYVFVLLTHTTTTVTSEFSVLLNFCAFVNGSQMRKFKKG